MTREEHPFHIDGKREVPRLLGHSLHSRSAHDAGIANQDMKVAKLSNGFLDHSLCIIFLADVCLDGYGTPTQTRNFGYGRLNIRKTTDRCCAILLRGTGYVFDICNGLVNVVAGRTA